MFMPSPPEPRFEVIADPQRVRDDGQRGFTAAADTKKLASTHIGCRGHGLAVNVPAGLRIAAEANSAALVRGPADRDVLCRSIKAESETSVIGQSEPRVR